MQQRGAAKWLAGCGFGMIVLLLCLGAAMIWFGLAEFAESRRYPQPVTLSFDAFVRMRPPSGWYRVTGGALYVRQAAWEEPVSGGSIKRAFVPMRIAGAQPASPAPVVVETKAPEILALVQSHGNSGLSASGFDQSVIQRPVEGRIPGFNRPAMIAARMAEAGIKTPTTSDRLYLAEGEAPSASTGWAIVGLGCAIIALVGAAVVKTIQEQLPR